MKRVVRSLVLAGGVLMLVGAGTAFAAGAKPAQKPVSGTSTAPPKQVKSTMPKAAKWVAPHKGHTSVSKEKQYWFETVWAPDAVTVYLYDKDKKPLQVGTATARATITAKGGVSKEVALTGEEDHWTGKLDLGEKPPKYAKATFTFKGLSAPETEATFVASYHHKTSTMSHPMKSGQGPKPGSSTPPPKTETPK